MSGVQTALQVNRVLILVGVCATGLLLPRALFPSLRSAAVPLGVVTSPLVVAAAAREDTAAVPQADHDGNWTQSDVVEAEDAVTLAAAAHSWCGPSQPAWSVSARSVPDWVFSADGDSAESWAAQFVLAPGPVDAGERLVHIVNRLSSGCVNLVGGDAGAASRGTTSTRTPP